ncbi:hypothetical protein KDK95_01340 [Actinospica sp. MGRD01-02]|uniref:Uncharacterized protein n=1 Tax=Actinospica acidithermotolerans TaxID=2828514 RepID=A0A941E6P8_9ACTN|nr:hypothetical protein [Actinospica acidithermotolerans]MBR7824933.1 hypothetical protein [Actinospica acidithermotolerans]
MNDGSPRYRIPALIRVPAELALTVFAAVITAYFLTSAVVIRALTMARIKATARLSHALNRRKQAR